MRMKFKHLTMILFIGVIFGTSQITTFSQMGTNDLLQQRITTDFSQACFLEVLSKLTVDYQIPIGLEVTTDYDEKVRNSMYLENGSIKWKPCKINIAAGTLQDVLDGFVQQEPDYKWEVIDNVINIYPVKLRDDFIKELLNTKVEYFMLRSNEDKFKIRDAIIDLPEVQAKLNNADIKSLKRAYSYKQSELKELMQSHRLEKMYLRGILNATIELTDHKMWTIRRIGENRDNVVLMF